MNFILDSLEESDGPKAYRYVSKGGKGYIADIQNMQLVRLGMNDVPLEAWELRKIPLNKQQTEDRKRLSQYRTEVYSSTTLEVTEICTRRQRFDIKG